jgi:hypothetical protein
VFGLFLPKIENTLLARVLVWYQSGFVLTLCAPWQILAFHTSFHFPLTMDYFTLLWTGLMGAIGLYLGVDSLLRGEITTSARTRWNMPIYRRPSALYYLLSVGFLLSGIGLLFLSFYLYA